jgi:tripartite tricarboxylate transporter family receptor
VIIRVIPAFCNTEGSFGPILLQKSFEFPTNSDSVAATLTSAGANDDGAAQLGPRAVSLLTFTSRSVAVLQENDPANRHPPMIEPILNKQVEYDPQKDFMPIAFIARNSCLLTINAQVPANSVKEFLAYAKANPGRLSLGFAQGTRAAPFCVELRIRHAQGFSRYCK